MLKGIKDRLMKEKPTYEELVQRIKELEGEVAIRERAEKILKNNEAKYQSLFENSGAATIIAEKDNTISMVNPMFIKLSGYSSQEIEGKMSWTEFVVPEDLEEMKRYHRERREKGKTPPSEYEFRFVDKSGNIRNIHNKVALIPGTGRSVASLIDITELKRATEELRESEKHFRDLAEMLPETVFVADKDMKIIFANQKAFSMFGYSKKDFEKGLNGFTMLVPKDRKRAHENVAKRFQNENMGVKEYQGLKKDGSTFPILLHTNLIIKQKDLVGFRGIIVDITEQKKIETKLHKSNDQLLMLTEQLRRLTMKLMVNESIERNRVARILHDDLQQMLVGAKLHLELFSKSFKGREQKYLEKSIELISQSIQLSRSLTEELVPVVLVQKDLGKIIKWLCDFVKKTYNLKVGLKLFDKIEINNEDIRLFVYQSIRELLFNTVKHSGTNIAHVTLRKDISGNLKIIVSDKGIGFDSDIINKGKDPDSHFGLFSIRERLSLLKGSLVLESFPGKGTNCTLKMPLTEITPFEESEKTFFVKGPSNKIQDDKIYVLVVDDHKVVREGFAALFGNEPDIKIIGNADNGQKAIEMALELLPDVILMDVNMPKLNGIKATRTIKSVLSKTQIIGLSFDDNEHTVDAMLEAGAAEFINKNNSATEILKAIRKLGCKV
jgi:PAS domain S-box-containing protein